MFNTFADLKAAAISVAESLQTNYHITGNNISFAHSRYDAAYMAITYSQDRKVAFNTFGLTGEKAISSRKQLQELLEGEIRRQRPFKVWADSESYYRMPENGEDPYYSTLDAACDCASSMVHNYDFKEKRFILHVDDIRTDETIDTVENILIGDVARPFKAMILHGEPILDMAPYLA